MVLHGRVEMVAGRPWLGNVDHDCEDPPRGGRVRAGVFQHSRLQRSSQRRWHDVDVGRDGRRKHGRRHHAHLRGDRSPARPAQRHHADPERRPGFRIYEVEVYADTNLALNKPATGSTPCSTGAGPGRLSTVQSVTGRWTSGALRRRRSGGKSISVSRRPSHRRGLSTPRLGPNRRFTRRATSTCRSASMARPGPRSPRSRETQTPSPRTSSVRGRPGTSGLTSRHRPRMATSPRASTRSRSTPALSPERTCYRR